MIEFLYEIYPLGSTEVSRIGVFVGKKHATPFWAPLDYLIALSPLTLSPSLALLFSRQLEKW